MPREIWEPSDNQVSRVPRESLGPRVRLDNWVSLALQVPPDLPALLDIPVLPASRGTQVVREIVVQQVRLV